MKLSETRKAHIERRPVGLQPGQDLEVLLETGTCGADLHVIGGEEEDVQLDG